MNLKEQEQKEIRDQLYHLLCEQIRDKYGDAVEVVRRDVVKNNGLVLDGVIVRTPDDIVSPTIYLNDAANRVFDWEESVNSACDQLLNSIEQAQNEKLDVDLHSINHENANCNIRATVINADKNKELLEQCPHELIEDLAIVCRCYVSDNASFIVKNEHLYLLQLSSSEALEIAKKNSINKDEYQIKNIAEVINEVMGMDDDIMLDDMQPPIYVITNQSRCQGAAGIFINEELRQEVMDVIGEDYYVIPSSIHEVLVVGTSTIEKEDLKAMIMDVNENHVSQDEYLSDEPYVCGADMRIKQADKQDMAEKETNIQTRHHAISM